MIHEKTEANSLYLRNQLTTSSNFFFKGNATFTFISSSSYIYIFFALDAEQKGSTCILLEPMDTRRDVMLIQLYPLSWRGWGRPESKLHTLRQPDDISDPSTGRRDRRAVWTCKYTEVHFSVQFLTANATYSEVWLVGRSESRLVRSDLWTNRHLNWTIQLNWFAKCS